MNRLIPPPSLLAILLAAFVIFISAPTLEAQERPINIAVVDLEVVVAKSAQGKALQVRLQKIKANSQVEAEKQGASVRLFQRKIKETGNTLKPEELDDLQHTYEQAKSDLRQYQDRKQREVRKIQMEGLRAIEKALKPVLEKLLDEKKIDLILNNTPSVVVMVGARVDITNLVIARADAAASAGQCRSVSLVFFGRLVSGYFHRVIWRPGMF